MDLTSLMSSLLSDQNIKAVASKAGVSEEEAASVLATALPVMLNGANGQASDAATTESFYKAVTDHAQKDPEKVDLKEGGKIVGHLLGTDEKAAEDAIAKRAGLSSANVGLILAAAAPLIMNMLGNSTSNSHSSSGTASLLNSLLGGGMNSSSSGNLMTSVLTSVLANSLNGGNNSNNSLLGSLLGSALPGLRQHRQQLQALLLRKPPRLPSGRHGRHAAAELFRYAGFSAGRFFQSAVLRA